MVDKIRPRKAAGSGDHIGTRNAGSRFHRQNERPQAPPRIFAYSNIADEYDGYEYDRHSRALTRTTPRLVELPQESSVDLEQSREAQVEQSHPPLRERSTTTAAEHDNNTNKDDLRGESSDSSEDWEELSQDATEGEAGALTTRNASQTPSYDFPGTWTAAAKDTAAALTQVTSATISYASAIASSGVGKAGWSIGTAALSSSNKLALSFAGWGMAKTGVVPSDLPSPIKKWVLSKEDKERRRKALDERKRRQKLVAGETVPVLFTEGNGSEAFMLELHQTTDEGEFVGSVPKSVLENVEREEGWEEQDLSVQQLEDYEGSEDEGEEGYGLMGVFEFDG